MCTLLFCNGIHFVTLYVMWRLRFENFTYILELLRCVQLRFYVMWRLRYVALRYVATSLYILTDIGGR